MLPVLMMRPRRVGLSCLLPVLLIVSPALADRVVARKSESDTLRLYVESFNATDRETVSTLIPNAAAYEFLKANIPLFDCPDPDVQRAYYFRWWTYRKHIRQTPVGFVVDEFLPLVPWAGKYNTISCAAGHHIYEGRWLRDLKFIDDYSRFWFTPDAEPRRYSFWAADAIRARALASGDWSLAIELLPKLVQNYRAWEHDHLDSNGLFWQIDDRDGMEDSIGGSGYRPTINSYMYGDAVAIAQIGDRAGRPEIAQEFTQKSSRLRQLVLAKLWDSRAGFFKTLPREQGGSLADVRELQGFTPWYFHLPDDSRSIAWRQVLDAHGFAARFGLTTAERRHPRFNFHDEHECLWNGPSWPFATSVTLTALANLLDDYQGSDLTATDYFALFTQYAKSHRLVLEDGSVVPWIDEDLDPDTGGWIARDILLARGTRDRGKDYNHSTFADLLITGLVGLRPRPDQTVEVKPLVPPNTWAWFTLDRIPYHGRELTIQFDRDGDHYHAGAGLRVFADGTLLASSPILTALTAELPAPAKPAAPSANTSTGWVKDPHSPVLGGKLGTCFDITVLRDANLYRMWFSWRPKASIALTESADGITWSEPRVVLKPNPGSKWEDDINRPVVLKQPDGTYHMWYTGQAAGKSWIGYATSPDGIAWKRMSDKPVLPPEAEWEKQAVMCPHVLFDPARKRFRMWYSAGEQYEPNAIGYAVSDDGIHWDRNSNNPIFVGDPSIAWEKQRVTACQVIPEADHFLMFYIGFRDVDHAQIGVARSPDGITHWQRHPANPIISPTQGGWDADAVYKPFALFDGRQWLLWYNGRDEHVEQIGLATHAGEDLGFPPEK